MKALTATTHLVEDDYIEVVAYIMVVCIVWTVVALVWVLA